MGGGRNDKIYVCPLIFWGVSERCLVCTPELHFDISFQGYLICLPSSGIDHAAIWPQMAILAIYDQFAIMSSPQKDRKNIKITKLEHKTVFSIMSTRWDKEGGRLWVNCFILPSILQSPLLPLLESFVNYFNIHYVTALSIAVQQTKFGRVLKLKLVEKWVKNISVMVETCHICNFEEEEEIIYV